MYASQSHTVISSFYLFIQRLKRRDVSASLVLLILLWWRFNVCNLLNNFRLCSFTTCVLRRIIPKLITLSLLTKRRRILLWSKVWPIFFARFKNLLVFKKDKRCMINLWFTELTMASLLLLLLLMLIILFLKRLLWLVIIVNPVIPNARVAR